MNSLWNEQLNRRKFLKGTLRFGMLGSLLFLGFELGLRHDENKQASSDCQLNTFCKNCSKWNKCNYPKAKAIEQSRLQKINANNKVGEIGYEEK